MHYPESRFCIRRVRVSRHGELATQLREAGYPVEDAVGTQPAGGGAAGHSHKRRGKKVVGPCREEGAAGLTVHERPAPDGGRRGGGGARAWARRHAVRGG